MLKNLSRLICANISKEVQVSKTPGSSSTGQLINRTALVLKKTEDIEQYVIRTIQQYFRTTYKNGVNKDSSLSDHGLDSLDSIEISMQIEQDLGYLISAETLPSFTKVKHYIKYIQQVEAYKKENNQAPLA